MSKSKTKMNEITNDKININNVNIYLLPFMYGSLLVRLTKDIKDINELNTKIESIGYDMGKRLVDDLIDDPHLIVDVSEKNKLMEILINKLFQNYLGINGNLSMGAENEYHFIFQDNPLSFCVELPESLNGLIYSNIICGMLRGILEISGFEVKCEFVKDKIKGDDTNDLKINLVKFIEERFIDDEE